MFSRGLEFISPELSCFLHMVVRVSLDIKQGSSWRGDVLVEAHLWQFMNTRKGCAPGTLNTIVLNRVHHFFIGSTPGQDKLHSKGFIYQWELWLLRQRSLHQLL